MRLYRVRVTSNLSSYIIMPGGVLSCERKYSINCDK